jgi:hypothetical protein
MNVEPGAGVAVKVTGVLRAKLALQVAPHEMPDGLLVIEPVPLPVRVSDTNAVVGVGSNMAVTEISALSVTAHVPVPVHPPPLQPSKTEPGAALAVRATRLPAGKSNEQPLPLPMQTIPGRLAAPREELVICPWPPPD